VFVATATEETSEQFAVTKEALRQTGTPLPMNDVWIAAHCLQLGATIVTLDGHFSTIPGLRVWPPAAC
jgi:predicted nucleic acid-binding protein